MGVVRRTISPHAAQLRRDATDAEQALWRELRSRHLDGFKFRRQWTIDQYIADFCCLEAGLIVEVDGGQHAEQRDRIRTDHLRRRGFRVIRFWNNDVLTNIDGVLQVIGEALATAEKKDPHHSPLPQAGEGA